MHLPVIAGDDIHPLQKHGFDRRLPRPQAQRVVGKRRVICIEHQRGAAFQLPRRVFLRASKMRGAFDQLGFEHFCVLPDAYRWSICAKKRQACYKCQIHSNFAESQAYLGVLEVMNVTRFAPSPNGSLHLGHAYSAIIAHDLALIDDANARGRFLLRIEDIDGTRSRPELAEEFRADLAWLGLNWKEVPAQSSRVDEYEVAAATLAAMGLLYPCKCSRAEIAAAATKMGPDGPVYPGTCKANPPAMGDDVAWRLDVAAALARTGPITWIDEIAGEQTDRADLLGDVVLVRKDRETPASYHLAVTLDDAADGVTLVTRGADLFAATHIHRLLQELLGLPVPRWHHHALLLDDEGRKLAKRRNSPSLADMRLAGQNGAEVARQLRMGQMPSGITLSAGLDNQP